MFLKDEIKNNNDELQRNLPKIIENINNNNDTSSEINKIEPSVLSEEKPSFLNNITSGKFKLKKVETENKSPILDTSKPSFLNDITSEKFKLKKAEPKTTNPILDTPKKEESIMNSSLIDKLIESSKSRRKHIQNEESDDDDDNEWKEDEPIKEIKKPEIFKETKEAFLKKWKVKFNKRMNKLKKII